MDKIIILLIPLVAVCHSRPQGYSYNPQGTSFPSFTPSRPSPTYGAPGYRPSGVGHHPSQFGNGGFSGNDYSEPANYQFQYDVTAPEYGTRFGHQESRVGDYTRGRYYVDLPDGRTQVVEYTADETGYHPRVSYS